jgi:hypothetical protein
MKTLTMPWAGTRAGSKAHALWRPIAAIVAAVYRGWQYAMNTRPRRTIDNVPFSREQSVHPATLLIESDIRDGVRGILP